MTFIETPPAGAILAAKLLPEGVVPDLVTTAKGIAGGMPLSAVTGRAELFDAVKPGGLGGTYGGNPVSCAAALGAIQTMRDWDLGARAQAIEAQVRSVLEPLVEELDIVGEFRGRGAMLALELVSDSASKTPHPTAAKEIASYCMDRGVIVLTAGTYGNVIRLLPPLVIGEELLGRALEILADAGDAVGDGADLRVEAHEDDVRLSLSTRLAGPVRLGPQQTLRLLLGTRLLAELLPEHLATPDRSTAPRQGATT